MALKDIPPDILRKAEDGARPYGAIHRSGEYGKLFWDGKEYHDCRNPDGECDCVLHWLGDIGEF